MIQGCMYAIAMLLALIPIILETCLTIANIELFALRLVINFLFPLQGMYNGFIYSGKLQNWFYNNETQLKCQCCSCCHRINFSSLHTSVTKLLYSSIIQIAKADADDDNEGKRQGIEEAVGIHDDNVSTSMMTRNAESSTLHVKNSQPMEIAQCDKEYVGKNSISIHDEINEEEKEEITAQFPINAPCLIANEDYTDKIK